MEFLDPDLPLTEEEINECEASCGLRFPQALRESYLTANGGEPDPYVFEDKIGTSVSAFLPLRTDVEIRLTAPHAYQLLIVEQRVAPPTYFPFAVDGGGNIFFADTSTSHGAVYFYDADTSDSESLVDLELGVADFWKALTPE